MGNESVGRNSKVDGQEIRVLVVDDAVIYRKLVSEVLAEMPGVEVVGTAPNGKIALEKIELLRPNLITLDMEMPVLDGLGVLRQLEEMKSPPAVIILCGQTTSSAKTMISAFGLGAFDFIRKPAADAIETSLRELRSRLATHIDAFRRSSHCARPPVQNRSQTSNRLSKEDILAPQVVAIGLSTGGPQALIQLLPALPADLPTPVVIVQHMPPVFTRSLADDLNRRCALTVCEAQDGEPLLKGKVYIAPGGQQMKVVRRAGALEICVNNDPPELSCRPSVDYLFRSVAQVFGAASIGVIMTGMGNDGTDGCRLLKRSGAQIICQDAASCVVYGMPRQPVEEGIADEVVPLNKLANTIISRVRRSRPLCT